MAIWTPNRRSLSCRRSRASSTGFFRTKRAKTISLTVTPDPESTHRRRKGVSTLGQGREHGSPSSSRRSPPQPRPSRDARRRRDRRGRRRTAGDRPRGATGRGGRSPTDDESADASAGHIGGKRASGRDACRSMDGLARTTRGLDARSIGTARTARVRSRPEVPSAHRLGASRQQAAFVVDAVWLPISPRSATSSGKSYDHRLSTTHARRTVDHLRPSIASNPRSPPPRPLRGPSRHVRPPPSPPPRAYTRVPTRSDRSIARRASTATRPPPTATSAARGPDVPPSRRPRPHRWLRAPFLPSLPAARADEPNATREFDFKIYKLAVLRVRRGQHPAQGSATGTVSPTVLLLKDTRPGQAGNTISLSKQTIPEGESPSGTSTPAQTVERFAAAESRAGFRVWAAPGRPCVTR